MSENVTTDPAEVLMTIGCALSYSPSEHLPSGTMGIVKVVWGIDENTRDTGGDGDELVAIVMRHDGKYAAIEGWADYTGWDCQSGCDVTIHDTAEDAYWHGITAEGRNRLIAAGHDGLPAEPTTARGQA